MSKQRKVNITEESKVVAKRSPRKKVSDDSIVVPMESQPRKPTLKDLQVKISNYENTITQLQMNLMKMADELDLVKRERDNLLSEEDNSTSVQPNESIVTWYNTLLFNITKFFR